MGQIILVRSGTTDYDEQERIVGNLDLPLNIRGQAELAELAREFQGKPIDRIYSAASESARESAQFLGEQLGVKVKILDDLRNLDFGLWQGLSVNEVRRKHPKLYRQWEECPCTICPPAGEMMEEVFARVQKPLKRVLRRGRKGTVLLVAPDPLRCVLRCCLKQLDLNQVWESGGGGAWETIEVEA